MNKKKNAAQGSKRPGKPYNITVTENDTIPNFLMNLLRENDGYIITLNPDSPSPTRIFFV